MSLFVLSVQALPVKTDRGRAEAGRNPATQYARPITRTGSGLPVRAAPMVIDDLARCTLHAEDRRSPTLLLNLPFLCGQRWHSLSTGAGEM